MTDDLTSVVNFIENSTAYGGPDMENDLLYLLGLINEALEHEGFENDSERAEYVIGSWCQELQYIPDLRNYETGQQVPLDGNAPAPNQDAFYHTVTGGDA